MLAAAALAAVLGSLAVAEPVIRAPGGTTVTPPAAATAPQPSGPLHIFHGPPLTLIGGNGLSIAQNITSPFEVTTVSAPAVAATPGVTGSPTTVQNPSLVLQFPIVPNTNYYFQGGIFHAYPTIGVTGTVALEACLTAQEAQAWPHVTMIPPPALVDTTCLPEANPATNQTPARTWYKVASANVDEYVVQSSNPVNAPTQVPVNIQQIVTPVRFHVTGFVYNYTSIHTGPNNYNAACPPEHCGNGNFELRTAPFTLVVLPAFIFQLKVLPHTIIYLPPGNKSFGSYQVTNTFQTVVTAGFNTEIDNTNANDQFIDAIDNNGASLDISKILSFGYSSGTETKFDTKTTLKTGQTVEHDVAGLTQVQTVATVKVTAASSNVPGANGSPANEPFWGDQVVLLVHPQFAVWDFYGKTTVQLVAASSANSLPDEVHETIADLDSCAFGTGPSASGIQITAATGALVQLNASDCKSLAALDPFWNRGQSANVSSRGPLFAPQQTYGVSPASGDDTSLDLKLINSQQETVTTQSSQIFASNVEDILATTQSSGLKIGLNSPTPGLTLGLTNDVTLKQGSTLDTTQTMNLTFKNSSAVQFRTDIQVEGSIDDNVNRQAYQPQVAVYLDNVFGGLMPVDPTAPPVACKPQPFCNVVVGGGALTNKAP
jgi:hypothetical protein